MNTNSKMVASNASREFQVIYLVTMEDKHGFWFLTGRQTWTNEHDDALVFATDADASKAAQLWNGSSVLCSGRWIAKPATKIIRDEDGKRCGYSRTTTAAQRTLKHAMNVRDGLRDLAVMSSVNEVELHRMADRVDAIAKQIGLAALTLKAAGKADEVEIHGVNSLTKAGEDRVVAAWLKRSAKGDLS